MNLIDYLHGPVPEIVNARLICRDESVIDGDRTFSRAGWRDSYAPSPDKYARTKRIYHLRKQLRKAEVKRPKLDEEIRRCRRRLETAILASDIRRSTARLERFRAAYDAMVRNVAIWERELEQLSGDTNG